MILYIIRQRDMMSNLQHKQSSQVRVLLALARKNGLIEPKNDGLSSEALAKDDGPYKVAIPRLPAPEAQLMAGREP